MEEQNNRQIPETSPDTQAQEIQQNPYPNPQQQTPYQNPQQQAPYQNLQQQAPHQNPQQQNFYQNPQQQAPYQNPQQQAPYQNLQQQAPYQNLQQQAPHQNPQQQNFYQNPQQAPYQNSDQQGQPNSWMHDSRLSGIDPAKLQALMAMAGQGAGKNQNELASFLMVAASKSRERGMTFSPHETDLIIDAMKQGRSPEEIAKIDRIRMMMRLLK